MKPPLKPDDEVRRLETLRRFDLLDTLPERALDDLTALAAHICGTPISLVSLIDENRQWFKSKIGWAVSETPRELSFCAHAIRYPGLFIVPDTERDDRFVDNPLVTGDPRVRFYAGAPLITSDGQALGTLCIIDRVPRELTPVQLEALQVLAREVMAQLELRRQAQELAASQSRLFRVFDNCPVGLAVNRWNDRTFTDANSAFSAITGWSREAIVGHTVVGLSIVSEAEAARVRSVLDANRHTGGAEMTIRTRSGESREVLFGSELVELRGEPHVVSTFVDITARKRAEEKLAIQGEILTAVTEALAAHLEHGDWKKAMGRLLRCALSQTQSEYGFIGVVIGGTLRVLAHEGIVWDKLLNRGFYEEALRRYEEVGYLEFTSFNNLFGRAITTGEVVIANTPESDSRSSGRPPGHPPMHSFLGVPIFTGKIVQGMVALANRPGGYSIDEQQRIETLVQHAGGLCSSYRHRESALVLKQERQRAEAARDESLERFQAVVRATNDAVWDWDLVTNKIWWNENIQTLFSYRADEIEPGIESWTQRLHPDDRERVIAGIHSVIDNKDKKWLAEYRFRRKNGSYADVLDRGYVLRNEVGRGVRMVGAMQDITARKEAEQRLWQLNRTYAVLHDINQLIVRERDAQTLIERACAIAVETGGFLMARLELVDAPKLTAHAGASKDTLEVLEQVLGVEGPGCVFTSQALANGGHAVCNDIAQDPQAAPWRDPALQRGYRAMVSLPLTVADRQVGTFNLYAGQQGFFDADELRLLDGLSMDIAFALEGYERERERQSALAQLRASEERFRELAETVQEVFWITDASRNRLLYVSPAYEKIWGRSCADLYAAPRTWLEVVHPDDRSRIFNATETKQVRGDYNEIYRIQRPDGVLRWIHARATPVRSPTGEVLRIVGTAEDITERRQLEEQYRQSQKMEAFGQLAGGVAHDFNNILAVILMQSQLSEMEEDLSLEAQTGLQVIRAAAERGANLTQQLLLFSHKQVMQPRDLDINAVVTHLVKMLQRLIEANVRLHIHLHPRPLLVFADAGMLDQVLINLSVNARDAMPEGGRLIIETAEKIVDNAYARLHLGAEPGRYVWLSVSDTGCGIAPEVLPRIFEPFYTTKGPGKGTGLGLATLFGIVQQHRGWVEVESEVGKGTTFQVFLPAIEANAIEVARAAESPPPGGKETILLVEDEPGVRTLTRAVLQRAGYRVLDAPDGTNAQQIWKEYKDEIALLLTDLVMPGGVSGRQLATEFKKDNSLLRVVFTSGYSADISGHKIALVEGLNFIQKPSSPRHILETVRRCLDEMAPK